ncbi:MAG TPA: transcriptional regulator [Acidimicrobiales bacterium]|jgi:transcriptional regulator with XRE-family HTH domain|nr:transcriptional regulator [Acidimicrobiales bacterium]
MAKERDDFEARYAAAVGARLRAVRRQKHLSLQAVEIASRKEFKASVLGAYERGERAISVPRLQRLAHLYQVPVDQLLPGDVPAGDAAARAGEEGARSRATRKGVRIDLAALRRAVGPEAAALQRFLSTIQLERQDFNGQVLTIRSEDLRVIGATLGHSPEEMVSRLERLGLLRRPS